LWITLPQEATQTFRLAGSILLVPLVIDVDSKLLREELGESAIREVEDVSPTHAEQVVDDPHVELSNHDLFTIESIY
jgi:hypothetical protein